MFKHDAQQCTLFVNACLVRGLAIGCKLRNGVRDGEVLTAGTLKLLLDGRSCFSAFSTTLDCEFGHHWAPVKDVPHLGNLLSDEGKLERPF